VIEPLRLTVELDCSREHAFSTWVERFGDWWPRSHVTSGDEGATVHFEPRAGGRIFERTTDGEEIEWGEVVEWDPPEVVSYQWHIRRDRSDATDVRLSFVDRGDGTSRMEIVHSGWERLGAEGVSWRRANEGGWAGLLPHYVEACSAVAGTQNRSNR
jgi:hypothetical protein